MKTAWLLLALIVFAAGCSFTRKSVVITGKSQEVANMVTPDFEKIDPGIARILKNAGQINEIKKIPQLTGEYDTVLNMYGFKITILDHKHVIVKSIEYENTFNGGSEIFEHITPYFDIAKDYYSNGNIRNKSVGSWLGFQIGKSYAFNEQGAVTKMLDSDTGYKFNFDDVINFCDKNKISLEKGRVGEHNWIEKRLYKGKPVWFITGYHDIKNDKLVTVILDGKTGQYLEVPNQHWCWFNKRVLANKRLFKRNFFYMPDTTEYYFYPAVSGLIMPDDFRSKGDYSLIE